MQKEEKKIENLFIAARNARETGDSETAIKHYEEICTISPNNWEAFFYLVILKTENITNGEISNSAISVGNCIPKVFELINSSITNEDEKKECVREVVEKCTETTVSLAKASFNYYIKLTKSDLTFDLMLIAANLDSKRKAKYESAQRMVNICNIMCICANSIEKIFGLEDEFYKDLAVGSWKEMIDGHIVHIKELGVAVFNEESIKTFSEKIKKYDPSYVVEDVKPTEKRSYAIKAILVALGILAISSVFCLWYWSIWN